LRVCPDAASKPRRHGGPMHVLVVYESVYGNTQAIADAVAEGARGRGPDATAQHVSAAPAAPSGADLLVVGGPTHMHGLTSDLSRRLAADAVTDAGDPLCPARAQGRGPG